MTTARKLAYSVLGSLALGALALYVLGDAFAAWALYQFLPIFGSLD